LVARAQRAATRLESAWKQWRALHGLAVAPGQQVPPQQAQLPLVSIQQMPIQQVPLQSGPLQSGPLQQVKLTESAPSADQPPASA